MFNVVNGRINILYNQHEFEIGNEKVLLLSSGDVFILEYDAEKYRAKVLGYGYDNSNKYALRIYVNMFDDHVYYLDMLVFTSILHQHGTQISVVADNERFFQLRVPLDQNTEELSDYLETMQGIRVKNWWEDRKDKYKFSSEEIGQPDWHIVFRASTNYGGIISLARLALLPNVFPGKVFILMKNHYSPEEFRDSSTVFYCLLGVAITPKICLETLKSMEN